jgi:putative flippase GtrA
MTATLTPELGRLARYAAVGVANTVVTLVAFAVLTRAGLDTPAASAAAFAAGAANGYRLNRRWTFASDARGRTLLVRYVGIQALGAAVSAGGASALVGLLAVARLAAAVSILPAVTIMTYLLTRRLFLAAR